LISALLEIFDWWGIQLDVEASNFFDSDKVLELAAASLQNTLHASRFTAFQSLLALKKRELIRKEKRFTNFFSHAGVYGLCSACFLQSLTLEL
jgi:hypothetical protein